MYGNVVRGDKVIFKPAFGEIAWAEYEDKEAEVLSVVDDEVEIVFEDGQKLLVVDFEVVKK